MEGLGQLGFWLAAGAVIVALIMRTWLRERDKQASLREMMNMAAGDKVTEVLAYLREKDAADRQLQREMAGLTWFDDVNWQRTRAVLAAIAVAVAAFVGGLIAGTVASETTELKFVPFGTTIAVWLAGVIIAWRIVRSSRHKKNDAAPVA